MILFQYILSDFTRFVDPENIRVIPRIVILCQLDFDILAQLNVQPGILEQNILGSTWDFNTISGQ